MAQFVLGLTKTAVEGTVIMVKSAMEEEAKLKAQVQQDLQFITGEFEAIHSVLKTASGERAKDEAVGTWVRNLRNLAFDVEDCAEFVVHLDDQPAWLWRVVPSLVPSCLSDLVPLVVPSLVPSCLSDLEPLLVPRQPLDQAAAELMLLKARVEEVTQRNTRYNLITGSGSKHITPAATPTACVPPFHFLRDVWETNRGFGADNLHNLITSDDPDHEVISVWSSAGGDPGTMSILGKAYGDQEICKKFENRAWVKLVHPFNPDEFRKSLLAQFYPDEQQVNDPIKQVSQEMYLIILEEVSSVVEWDAIRKYLPVSKNGSRIIVSTQHLWIALMCTEEPYRVSELRRSTDGHSLCAFYKKKGCVLGNDAISKMKNKNRMGEARDWTAKNPLFGREVETKSLKGRLKRKMNSVSVWGIAGVGKSALVRTIYNKKLLKLKEKNDHFVMFSWVDVPDQFNLTDLSKRLLLDFHSDDLEAKESAEIGIVEGLDPIQECRKILCGHRCLIVIDGLRLPHDWDSIKDAFLSDAKTTQSCIVVITNDEKAAEHVICHVRGSTVLNVKGPQDCADKLLFTKKNMLVGYEDETKKLADRLKRKMNSVSVWGIAGIGKSALVRTIYNKELKKKNDRFVMFSWVDMPDQFNLMELSQRLLLDFHSDDLEAKERAAIGIIEGLNPIQECRKILCGHRCLIVIDGLRLPHYWDSIKDAFLSDAKTTQSCIVVITNDKKAAEHVICHVPGSKVLNVKGLQDYAAKLLFKKVIKPEHINDSTGEDMERLSQLTTNKSGPLPRVIDDLGHEDMERLTQLTMDNSGSLPKVIDALGRELCSAKSVWHASTILENYTTLDSLSGLFSWMQSYFDACSDSLKPCIFYLSVFPIGQNIRRRRLVTRWIAEGYSRDRFGSTSGDWESSRDRYGSTADENGQKFFSDLTQLSIIQQLTTNNVYQVNGFFHGYIISRPMEDNLVFALEGFHKPNSQRTGQHLTIRSSWDRDSDVYNSIDFTRLRSLTVFGRWVSFLISKKMKVLRVLDLEDTSGLTDKELENIVKLVTRLKFLSLRGCRDISRLPDSMDDMRQLQTVDVRHTSIVRLPLYICNLPKLQYIHAGNTEPWFEGDGIVTVQSATDTTPPQDVDGTPTILPPTSSAADNVGVEVPTGIGSLTVLHTLGVVHVPGAGGKALVEELKKGKLPRLHKLKVSGINKENIQDFFSAISGHRHLDSLSVRLDDDVQHDFILPVPPKTLRKLKLYGNVLNLPVWINKSDSLLYQKKEKSHSLECFDIEMTITTGEDLLPLEELVTRRILRRLCVKLTNNGDLNLSMPNHQCSNFQNLKIDCRSKTKVTFGESKLVEVLKVKCSEGSDLRFSGLDNLKSLKEVWLMGAYGDMVKQELAQQLSKHPKKPVLKLVRPRDVC